MALPKCAMKRRLIVCLVMILALVAGLASTAAAEAEVEAIFAARMQGEAVTEAQQAVFKTAFMMFVARKYREMNWTMQLHYGCRRDNNLTQYASLGPDTG